MIKKIVIFLVVVGVVGGGYLLFSAKKPSPDLSGSQVPTKQQEIPSSSKETVTIKNFAFNPSKLTVKKGTVVTWVNEDSATHTIKSDKFNSTDLSTGAKFEFLFDTIGTYTYSCGIHPTMQGTIEVVNG